MAILKCYTLTFDPLQERFDVDPLNADSTWDIDEIVDAKVFSYDGLPRLAIVVRASKRTEPRGDYRAMLRASERPLFDRLKQWRSTTARDASIPAHRVASNRVLAALAALRPSSISSMLEVPGIGPQTVRRYGSQLLRIVNGADHPPVGGPRTMGP